jgi:TetR/AcrR family transcriptional repressor of nem operon
MRTKAGEKEKLKEKILTEALPFLKKFGRDGAPVDKIMAAAGLTSGALYSHFKSKDDLFTQVILRELDRVRENYETLHREKGARAIPAFLDLYLQDAHIDAVEKGCVFVALGADMKRLKPAEREKFDEKIEAVFQAMAQGFGGSAKERMEHAAFLFSSVVGAITFARSMKSRGAATAVLSATKKELLKVFERSQP